MSGRPSTSSTDRGKPWPIPAQFNEAMQHLRTSMADVELQGGKAAVNKLGLPLLYSGNFADVYQVHCEQTGNTWAVKCFTKGATGLRERYSEISRHLGQAKLPFMVDFRYLDQGVRIEGAWYPIVKMRWIEGLRLNEFVRWALDSQPRMLDQLLTLWVTLAVRLREAEIAHADLQHGNVLLVPKDDQGNLLLRLIDYDGMYVPALADRRSGELGHPSYQHPQRASENIYSFDVDRFSHLAICCALRCLRVGGIRLWDQFDNGDNLLFTAADFLAPSSSAAFRQLWILRDQNAHAFVAHLALATLRPLNETPLVEDLIRDGQVQTLNDSERQQVQKLLEGVTSTSAAVAAEVPRRPSTADPIAEAPDAAWYVRPPSGSQYGPARGDVMKQWLVEGRVSSQSLVWREGWADWKVAGDVFPFLSLSAQNVPPIPGQVRPPTPGEQSEVQALLNGEHATSATIPAEASDSSGERTDPVTDRPPLPGRESTDREAPTREHGLLRRMARGADRFLGICAGEGNTLLHNFFRVVAVAAEAPRRTMTFCDRNIEECRKLAVAQLPHDESQWITRDQFIRAISPSTHLLVAHVICPVLERLASDQDLNLPDLCDVCDKLSEYKRSGKRRVKRNTVTLGNKWRIEMKEGGGGSSMTDDPTRGRYQFYDGASWRLDGDTRFRIQVGIKPDQTKAADIVFWLHIEVETTQEARATRPRAMQLDQYFQDYTAQLFGDKGFKSRFAGKGKPSRKGLMYNAGELVLYRDDPRLERFPDTLFWIIANLNDLRDNLIAIADRGKPITAPPRPLRCKLDA